jgi:hypothetical protein
MMIINQQNVEEYIFYKPELCNKLLEKKHLISAWKFSIQNPSLRAMGKTSLKQFLKTLTQEEIVLISKYYGEEVKIEAFDNSLIKNLRLDIETAEFFMPIDYNFIDFAVYRGKENLEVTLWK